MMAKRFVLFGQHRAGRGGSGGEGGNAGNGLDFNARHQLADDAGEVAEGGESGGVAFNQKDQIAALGEQGYGAGCGACQALARMSASRVIGKDQFLGIAGIGKPPRSTMDSA
jgi:hypothetical protein